MCIEVVETEANREALRKELANMQRKFAEFEDEVRVREKDFAMALEDSRRNERKLNEDRHNLELTLDNANADIQVSNLFTTVIVHPHNPTPGQRPTQIQINMHRI